MFPTLFVDCECVRVCHVDIVALHLENWFCAKILSERSVNNASAGKYETARGH